MFKLNLETKVMEEDGDDVYEDDMGVVRPVDGVSFEGVPSLTKQSFAEEVDINTIVRRFGIGSELPERVAMVTNGDFVGPMDFQTAMGLIVEARESFMAMPADVRTRFDNDPAKFVEFCSDEKNADEAIKLGLVSKEAADRRTAAQAKAAADALAKAVDAEIAARKSREAPVST